MHFVITYRFTPETRDAVQKRFLDGGGVPPSAGVTMLQRWHAVGGHSGFIIAEAASVVPIGKWMQEWTDLLTFDITPIMNDEEIQEILGV
jgi:hypothetical protein